MRKTLLALSVVIALALIWLIPRNPVSQTSIANTVYYGNGISLGRCLDGQFVKWTGKSFECAFDAACPCDPTPKRWAEPIYLADEFETVVMAQCNPGPARARPVVVVYKYRPFTGKVWCEPKYPHSTVPPRSPRS